MKDVIIPIEDTEPGTFPCPKCGHERVLSGYGYAAGKLGSYEMCASCGETLTFEADPEFEPERVANEPAWCNYCRKITSSKDFDCTICNLSKPTPDGWHHP